MGKNRVWGWIVVIHLCLLTLEARTFDSETGALYQPSILMGDEMAAGDVIQNSAEAGSIYVLSDNIETNDLDYKVAKCVLKQLGYELPRSRNGVYWARWKSFNSGSLLNGTTSRWQGLAGVKRYYTFIHTDFQGARTAEKEIFVDLLLTLYHEVKGHNIDDEDHDSPEAMRQFERKYEGPIRIALSKNSVLQARAHCTKH